MLISSWDYNTFVLDSFFSLSFTFLAKVTPKNEVKACFQCKNAESCKPEKLDGSEIRTSGAFGGKNLYCFTVSRNGA
jgi:hypothetical protein